MPGIGNPNIQSNPFKGIRMAAKEPSKKSKEATLDEKLNNLAGVKQETRFKDAKEHNKLGKDAFLKLLTHQLKNQDPYKPMDQKKFAADLAQFSQLEQLSNLNTKMDKMGGNVPTESKFYGASFLGKMVETKGTSVQYDGQGSVTLPFSLPKAASKVMVRVFDSKQQMVAQIDSDSLGAGANQIKWNGKQLDGAPAVKDTYVFEVRAWDRDYNEFKGETRAKGKVTGVAFDEKGDTVLTIDGKKKIYLRDVKSFGLPEMTAGVKKMPTLNKSAQSAYNKTTEQSY